MINGIDRCLDFLKINRWPWCAHNDLEELCVHAGIKHTSHQQNGISILDKQANKCNERRERPIAHMRYEFEHFIGSRVVILVYRKEKIGLRISQEQQQPQTNKKDEQEQKPSVAHDQLCKPQSVCLFVFHLS